jgi:hypothetical protein
MPDDAIPARRDEAGQPTALVSPSDLLQELRALQETMRLVADSAGSVTSETRRKARLYEDIRHVRTFEE